MAAGFFADHDRYGVVTVPSCRRQREEDSRHRDCEARFPRRYRASRSRASMARTRAARLFTPDPRRTGDPLDVFEAPHSTRRDVPLRRFRSTSACTLQLTAKPQDGAYLLPLSMMRSPASLHLIAPHSGGSGPEIVHCCFTKYAIYPLPRIDGRGAGSGLFLISLSFDRGMCRKHRATCRRAFLEPYYEQGDVATHATVGRCAQVSRTHGYASCTFGASP